MPPMPHPSPRPRPFPYYRPQYVIVQRSACKPVYNNSQIINNLNSLLATCDSLKLHGINTCSQSFKNAVQKELTNQLNKAVYIGSDCSLTVYPTY